MIAVLAAAAAVATAAPEDTEKQLRAVQSMYQQSCQVKAYGSYDDICNLLKKQLKEAERAHKRSTSRRAAAPPPPQPVAVPPAVAGFAPAARN